MLASPIPQYFQESYSVSPPHTEQSSALETSKELFCESKPQSQNILDSHSSQNFKNQDSYNPLLEHPLEKTSLEKSIEILQESTLQFQKSSSQSIDRLDTQLSKLVNIYKNEKTLSLHLWPIQISLTLLIWPMTLVVLETKIPTLLF